METNADRPGPKSRPTILVCEDQALLRKTLVRDLENEGYALLEAGDGEAACEILGGFAVDLLITDVKLPGMSGWDVVAFTRDHHGAVPIIVMSAYGLEDKARNFTKAFSCSFLDKPFPMATMRAEVQRALGMQTGAERKYRPDA